MPIKEELRHRIRGDRANEPAPVTSARADAMASHAGKLAHLAAPGVAGYLPTNAEPDVGPLLRALGVTVYLPRIAGRSLEWVPAVAQDVTGTRHGIPRPEGTAVASGAELVTKLGLRLLLVPALAVDPDDGTRLGYGAGWYDRLLAEVRGQSREACAIGVCRGADLVAVPRYEHDEPLDGVLTESGLRWFRRSP